MVRTRELLAKLDELNLILREGFTGLGMCIILVVQSEQHVIYRLMAGKGVGGRPRVTWKKLTEKDFYEWSSRLLTLKKGAPGDQV